MVKQSSIHRGFKSGQPHGKGKVIWFDNNVYNSEWINGVSKGFEEWVEYKQRPKEKEQSQPMAMYTQYKTAQLASTNTNENKKQQDVSSQGKSVNSLLLNS